MKKIQQLLSVGVLFILIFSSCTIEKRRYLSGYDIQWKNSKPVTKTNELARENKPGKKEKSRPAALVSEDPVEFKEIAFAGQTKIKSVRINKRADHYTVKLPEECDVIILRNGDEIKARVSEISHDEIRYRKCEDMNGSVLILKKTDVFMIKYPNGTKDVFSAGSEETKNKAVEKEDTGTFGILSFVFAIASIFLGAVTSGVATLIFIPLAIVFGIIGLGKGRKLKGFAIAGLTIGIAFILLLIIFLIAFSDGIL